MVPKYDRAHSWAGGPRGKLRAGAKLAAEVRLQICRCCCREGAQHLQAPGLVPLPRHKMCGDAHVLGGIHGIDLPTFTSARGSWHLDKASAFESRLS